MSATPAAELPPTLALATFNAAISSISPALEILERFHHRNKNQHRLSKWWAQADMLRRHTRKMLVCLEAGVPDAERLERIRARGKTKKKKEGGDDTEEGNLEVKKRAEHLRWTLAPRAYLAFTQLSTDRQFAHLGLMLLGVLAQIDKALAPFTPLPNDALLETDAEGAATDDTPGPLPNSNPSPPDGNIALDKTMPQPQTLDLDGDTDMGVAVSRDEIILLSIERGTSTGSTPAPAPTSAQTEPTGFTSSKLTAGPSSGSISEPPVEVGNQETRKDSPSIGPPVIEKRMKKRLKGAGGDEFDDIFSALDKDKVKKPKKRKRKKGDEFDDIFGGLV